MNVTPLVVIKSHKEKKKGISSLKLNISGLLTLTLVILVLPPVSMPVGHLANVDKLSSIFAMFLGIIPKNGYM